MFQLRKEFRVVEYCKQHLTLSRYSAVNSVKINSSRYYCNIETWVTLIWLRCIRLPLSSTLRTNNMNITDTANTRYKYYLNGTLKDMLICKLRAYPLRYFNNSGCRHSTTLKKPQEHVSISVRGGHYRVNLRRALYSTKTARCTAITLNPLCGTE